MIFATPEYPVALATTLKVYQPATEAALSSNVFINVVTACSTGIAQRRFIALRHWPFGFLVLVRAGFAAQPEYGCFSHGGFQLIAYWSNFNTGININGIASIQADTAAVLTGARGRLPADKKVVYSADMRFGSI